MDIAKCRVVTQPGANRVAAGAEPARRCALQRLPGSKPSPVDIAFANVTKALRPLLESVEVGERWRQRVVLVPAGQETARIPDGILRVEVEHLLNDADMGKNSRNPGLLRLLTEWLDALGFVDPRGWGDDDLVWRPYRDNLISFDAYREGLDRRIMLRAKLDGLLAKDDSEHLSPRGVALLQRYLLSRRFPHPVAFEAGVALGERGDLQARDAIAGDFGEDRPLLAQTLVDGYTQGSSGTSSRDRTT